MGFTKLNINHKLLEGIKNMGFTTPTPIQEKCIPEIKAGRDLVGQSLTGSGKTAAFGLPILEKIVPGNGLQALVLTPTRELCHQVRDHLEQMSKFMPINITSIYGGVGYYQQIEELKYAEIIVATPGRLIDLINRRNVNLGKVRFVVLDEADKMFEMGFEEDVDKILRTTPNTRQTIMFSATMPRAAQNIIKKYLKTPVLIQEKLQVDKTLLKQVFYSVRKDEKFSLLVHLLKEKTPGPAIVFCGTKREVDKVALNLKREKITAMPVHGDLRQGRRQFAVNSFKEGKIDVLVATDVAARGLDIKDVTHVYNYDVPRTPEEYTHRIGRTARAGKKGDAVTLLSERDYNNFNKIVRFGKMDIVQEKVPTYAKVEYRKESAGRDSPSDDYQERRGGFSHGHGRGFGGDRGRGFPKRESSFPRRSEGSYSDPQESSTSERPQSYSRNDSYPRRESSYGNRSEGQTGGRDNSFSPRPSYGPRRDNQSSYGNNSRSSYPSSRPSYGDNSRSSYGSPRQSSYGDNSRSSYGNNSRPSYGSPRQSSYGNNSRSSYPRQNNSYSQSSSKQDTPVRQDNFPRQDPYSGQKHHNTPFKHSDKKETTQHVSQDKDGGIEKTPRTAKPLFDSSHYSDKYEPKGDASDRVLPELRREVYIDHRAKQKNKPAHKSSHTGEKPSHSKPGKKKYVNKKGY